MTATDDERRFARIASLFDVGTLGDLRVLIAGCGSGGGNVALQLAMSGVKNFDLLDNDSIELENTIRHICGTRYVGWRKVEAVADLLRDRNPRIDLSLHDIDALLDDRVQSLVAAADIVVIATDNDPTRWRLNEICVRTATPYTVARVFTRGIGGEVFAYRPSSGGCLSCLEAVLERTSYRSGIREIDLVSDEERDAVYGLPVAEIKDSPGLNVDISFITAFQTRFTLDAMARLLAVRPQYMSVLEENYLVWGNRPVPPFDKNFQLQRITLAPQDGCSICDRSDQYNAD